MHIIKPIISEKSMKDAAAGKFTFHVGRSSTKPEIKQAVELQFNVHVKKIMTRIVKGKSQRIGVRRVEVQKQPMKKAIVELMKGEKIALFEQVA